MDLCYKCSRPKDGSPSCIHLRLKARLPGMLLNLCGPGPSPIPWGMDCWESQWKRGCTGPQFRDWSMLGARNVDHYHGHPKTENKPLNEDFTSIINIIRMQIILIFCLHYRHTVFYCTSQILHVLQMEGLWQPCNYQVYGHQDLDNGEHFLAMKYFLNQGMYIVFFFRCVLWCTY